MHLPVPQTFGIVYGFELQSWVHLFPLEGLFLVFTVGNYGGMNVLSFCLFGNVLISPY